MRTLVFLALCCLGLGITTATIANELIVEQPYVRELVPGQTVTAGFFSLQNNSERDQTLVSVSANVAAEVQIHEGMHAGGGRSMQQVPSLTIPAGGRVVLKPGGSHLMLFDLQQPLQDGDEIELILVFESGEQLVITAPVISILKE